MKRRKKRMASSSSSDTSDSDGSSSSDASDSDSSSSSDTSDSDGSSSSDTYDSDGSSCSDTYDSEDSDSDSDSDKDDSYLSSRYAKDLISDEKYAEELQLQEALIFSASKINTSSEKDAPSSSKNPVKEEPSLTKKSVKEEPSSSIAATSLTKNPLKRKRGVVEFKAAKLPKSLCGICMDTKAPSEMFSNGKVCRHQFCLDSIREHISVKIKENIVKVTCPEPQCKELIGPDLCRSILPKQGLERWEDALCESLILGTQKFYCPFKDCSALLVDDGGEAITSSECPNCNRLFCAQCKVAWHSGMYCKEFKSLKKNVGNPDKMLMELAKKKKWKKCPYCKFMVEKKYGCNHISCRCGHDFCYRCGKKDKYGTHVCRSRDVSP